MRIRTALAALLFTAMPFYAVAMADPPQTDQTSTVDPCVYGYPADPTVFADGTPAPELPCTDWSN